jgi:hypothetical protein
MKRVVFSVLAAALVAPAFAQGAETELKEMMTRYVQAFNKADAPLLATEFYSIPGEATQTTELKLAEQFNKLRGEEFGKIDLYSIMPCVQAPDAAQVEMKFAYIYTFGGAMPPGDQAVVFDMKKGEKGWRIAGSNDLEAGRSFVCAR